MLKQVVNECHFTLVIKTDGPLLIRDGRLYDNWKDSLVSKEEQKNIPDSIFVCQNPKKELDDAIKKNSYCSLKFYIPGTSLRGVMRSHAEKIARTLSDGICCDPFSNDACSKKIEESEKFPYKKSCSICKLFGNTHSASRIQVLDSTIMTEKEPEARDGIAIDRFTGGVSQGANMKNQFLTGSFKSKISIRNFELWQLGLLAYVLRDFGNGLIPLGAGKNKGFGRVKTAVENIQLNYFRKTKKLMGIGEILDKEKRYGFISVSIEKPFNLGKPTCSELYRERFDIKMAEGGKVIDSDFWRTCAGIWNKAVPKFNTCN